MIQHLLCIKVSTIKEYQAILTIGHLFFNILHRILYVLSFITYIKNVCRHTIMLYNKKKIH